METKVKTEPHYDWNKTKEDEGNGSIHLTNIQCAGVWEYITI